MKTIGSDENDTGQSVVGFLSKYVNGKVTRPDICTKPPGFPSLCPESTRPTDSCFQGTSCENLVTYGGLYQNTRVVLYYVFIIHPT